DRFLDRDWKKTMISGITGSLARVLEDEIRLTVGAFEYQILVPETVRRQVQMKLGEEISLRTLEFIDGQPNKGRLTPRMVGFLSEPEMEFFSLFCTVDGVGVRTALRAMVRPVRDVAAMIQQQDAKLLETLPGVSASLAERIIAKLRKKVAKFALMVDRGDQPAPSAETSDVIQETFLALLSIGHSEADAHSMLETAQQGRTRKFTSVQDVLQAVYEKQ
ncbi:MAG: Holliday junction branch migration protein RuvA, partial [Planctomycetia bacterium]